MNKKRLVLLICCIMTVLMCSCGNVKTQESEENLIESVQSTIASTTENVEISETDKRLETSEKETQPALVLTEYAYKYLSEYELETIFEMEKIIEFDLDNWATQMASINESGLTKEDIVKMVQNDEIDWDTLLKSDHQDEIEDLLAQFLDVYTYDGYQFSDTAKKLFPEALAVVFDTAGISDGEWSDFKQVFDTFQTESSEIWEVYSTAKDEAWEEYDQTTSTAWEEYDSQKIALWTAYETKKQEITDKYESELKNAREKYFENNNLAQYEEVKKGLYAAKEEELDSAWKEYDIQVDGGEGVESLYSQYKSKKDAAWKLYDEKEKAAAEARSQARDEAFIPVKEHSVYQKLYEISDTDIWTELLIAAGEE